MLIHLGGTPGLKLLMIQGKLPKEKQQRTGKRKSTTKHDIYVYENEKKSVDLALTIHV